MNNSPIITAFEQGIMLDTKVIAGIIFVAAGVVFANLAIRQRKGRIFTERTRKPTTEPETLIPGRARVMVLSNHGATMLKSVIDRIEALRRTIDQLHIEKAKISIGLEGEKAVGGFFLRHLNDDWTVIEGFLGEKGEIDFVLVGPLGVFAIEVKNRAGIISCNGDQWAITKPDGSVELIKDNGGRSPARQLNESAGWLASKLHHAGFSVRVPTAIVWAHPKATMGAITNIGINYLILLGSNAHQHFKGYLALGTRLTREQVSGIVACVKSIHKGR